MNKIQDLAAVDWTEAIGLYHQGDWPLEKLRDYADRAQLPEAARASLKVTLEIGRAMSRQRNRAALEQLRNATKARHERVVFPVELSTRAREIAGQYLAESPALAAATGTPSGNLKALCDVRCTLRYATPQGQEQTLELVRYLSDDWKLVVLPPGDDVVGINCGGRLMNMDMGVYSLSLKCRRDDGAEVPLPADAIAEIVCREMLLTFRQGPQLAVIFA